MVGGRPYNQGPKWAIEMMMMMMTIWAFSKNHDGLIWNKGEAQRSLPYKDWGNNVSSEISGSFLSFFSKLGSFYGANMQR